MAIRWLTTLLLLISFTAERSNALMGGISGGGGNVLFPTPPSDPMDPESTQHLIRGLKTDVVNYVATKENSFREGSLSAVERPAFAALFELQPGVAQRVSVLGMKVEDDDPCFDFSHQEVDGSTIRPGSDRICISALRIAKKVDKSEIKAQSMALMIHEYGEILGLTEEQATHLQQTVLKELRGY